MEKIIKRGAEADIILGRWCNRPAIFKLRKRKLYMNPKLDTYIRKLRTIREAINMNYAKKLGVPTPNIYYVSTKKFLIVMKYIEGVTLKEKIEINPNLGKILGIYLGKLHKGGLAHGDPTTANLLYDKSIAKFVFIDFGLSMKTRDIEDYAVDFHLVKEVLSSVHQRVFEKAYESFKLGYAEEVGESFYKRVVKRVEEIEKRGRYTRVG